MRIAVIILTLFTLLAADRYEHHDTHLPLDISHLHLTDRQYEAVERIVLEHKKAHRRFKQHKQERREDIARLFAADSFDSEAFVRLTSQLRDEAVLLQSQFFRAIHDVLTPEQRRLFIIYMEEWEIE